MCGAPVTAGAKAPTLTEWLLEQIEADEAMARAVLTARFGWASVDFHGAECAAHGARWDPARVLAECAAKRAIVEMWAEAVTDDDGTDDSEETLRFTIDEQHTGVVVALRDVIRALASVYADRPGWQEEWR